MDSLEKLFISCLTLFGLFILFLFGLYFDLGDILAGMLKKGDAASTGIATSDYQMRLMEWQGRKREIMPMSLMDPAKGVLDMRDDDPNSVLGAILTNSGYYRPITTKDRMEMRRQELHRQGCVRQDYVEMEALACDREEFDKVMVQARQLAADKQYNAAIGLIQRALDQTDPKNLYVLKDYTSFLLQLQTDGRQIDKAEETAKKLYELLDRILMIQRTGVGPGRQDEIAAIQTRIKGEKDRLGDYFAEVKKRTAATGSATGLYPEEKEDVKATLRKLKDSGQITEADYQRSLKMLEANG